MRKILITMIAIAFSLSAFSANDDVTLLGEWDKLNKPSVYAWCVGGMVVATVVFFDELDRDPLSEGISFQLLNEDSKPMKCSEYKK